MPLVTVCCTALARLVGNIDGITRLEITGDFTETRPGPWGFTLAELQVLDRYRRRNWP
jgi:hypothetical protein